METEAWVIIERTRAATWRDWSIWFYETDQSGPEPILTTYEKNVVRKLIEYRFTWSLLLKPTILAREWVLLSINGVTKAQIDRAYLELGDILTGGDFGLVGYWTWDWGDSICVRALEYTWSPLQVLKFMPDVCTSVDPVTGACLTTAPATEILQFRLMGQPERDYL